MGVLEVGGCWEEGAGLEGVAVELPPTSPLVESSLTGDWGGAWGVVWPEAGWLLLELLLLLLLGWVALGTFFTGVDCDLGFWAIWA